MTRRHPGHELINASSRVSQEVSIPRHRAIFFADRSTMLDAGAVSD
jgi:hypothetical protein